MAAPNVVHIYNTRIGNSLTITISGVTVPVGIVNPMIVVMFNAGGNANMTAMDWNGEALTLIPLHTDSFWSQVAYVRPVSRGPQTLIGHLPFFGAQEDTITVVVLENAADISLPANMPSDMGFNNQITQNVLTTQDDSLVFQFGMINGNQNSGVGPSQVQINNGIGSPFPQIVSYKAVPVSGTLASMVSLWQFNSNYHFASFEIMSQFSSPSPSPSDTNSMQDILCLDGTNGTYVEIPDNDDFSVTTTGELSISFWIKPNVLDNLITTASTDGEYIDYFGKGRYGPNEYEWTFRFYNLTGSGRPNRMSFYVFNESAGIGVGSFFQDTITPHQWIHVIGKIDATKTYIYKNGSPRDNDVYSGTITPVNTTTPVRLGSTEINTTSDPCYIDAAFDDVQFFNFALSDAQAAAIYAAGRNALSGAGLPVPIHRYKFDDISGSIAHDSIGSLDGMLHGAARFCIDGVSPSASMSPSLSPSSSLSSSASPSVSPSSSVSSSASASQSPSSSRSPSASRSLSVSPSGSMSPSHSTSPSVPGSGQRGNFFCFF